MHFVCEQKYIHFAFYKDIRIKIYDSWCQRERKENIANKISYLIYPICFNGFTFK